MMGGFRHSGAVCGRLELLDDRQDLGRNHLFRLHGVDHAAALRLARGNIEKGFAPFLVGFEPLLLESVGRFGSAALLRPLQADLCGNVEYQGAIRHDAIDGDALQRLDKSGSRLPVIPW